MRKIVLLLFDGVNALDVAGPAEAFACVRSKTDKPVYVLQTLSADRLTVRSESGLKLVADGLLPEDGAHADLLIIPGGHGVRAPSRLARIAGWLRENQGNYRRVAAVCTGAYALAEAGLLDKRKATTHWRFGRAFARAYPSVSIDTDSLFIRDGKFYTSGGVAAGIDLTLSLIEEDHGARAAARVAREMVMFLRRTGGQAQFSEPLKLQIGASDRVGDVCAWAAGNLHCALSVDVLAERAHLSSRQFSRLFAQTYAMPPARYISRLRLDAARTALALGDGSISQIAEACGFASADAFRRAFEREFKVSPREYQRRFSASERQG